MSGRQRFKCECGLIIDGRERGGLIYAYDRAGYDGSPIRPAMCQAHTEGKGQRAESYRLEPVRMELAKESK